jgi:hypothetical protein
MARFAQLIKGMRYDDSQQLPGVIWSATAVGEAAEVILIDISLVNTNKCKWEVYLRFKVLEKAPIAGDG